MASFDFDYNDLQEHHIPPVDRQPREWQGQCRADFVRQLNLFRRGLCNDPQFTYMIYASVGSGKTYVAALIASRFLTVIANPKMGLTGRIVYVCPNDGLAESVEREFQTFNIRLRRDSNGDVRDGKEHHGIITTYQSLAQREYIPGTKERVYRAAIRHRENTQLAFHSDRRITLVIFDENHHMGDRLAWAQSAKLAFAHASYPNDAAACPYILSMSGTPFRHDKREIPFVRYNPQRDGGLFEIHADYRYTIGDSVADTACRLPTFEWYGARATTSVPNLPSECIIGIQTPLPEEHQQDVLRLAITPGSPVRRDMLRDALARMRKDNRKLIIFVGKGASTLTPTEDASELKKELVNLHGVDPSEIDVVTHKSEYVNDPYESLRTFGDSRKKILITVKMVSEGVNIPELSMAVFLTDITAPASVIQRIGRVMRYMPTPTAEKPHAIPEHNTAVIYMFDNPDLRSIAQHIQADIAQVQLARAGKPRESEHGERNYQPKELPFKIISAFKNGVTVDGTHMTDNEFQRGFEQLLAARPTLAARGSQDPQVLEAIVTLVLNNRVFSTNHNGGAA